MTGQAHTGGAGDGLSQSGGAPDDGVPDDGSGTTRLEAFTDAVMAIAITLLVLDFKVPEGPPERTEWRLAPALRAQWPSYLAYAMSFVVLGLTWASHHRLFRLVARVDWRFLLLNVLLLMAVAFVPYPTALVAKYLPADEGRREAVLVYGGTMAAVALAFNALWWYARTGGRLLAPDADPRAVRATTRQFAVGLAGYLGALALAWVVPLASLALYAGLALFFAVAPGRGRNTA